jgi:hypothetical protein
MIARDATRESTFRTHVFVAPALVGRGGRGAIANAQVSPSPEVAASAFGATFAHCVLLCERCGQPFRGFTFTGACGGALGVVAAAG